MIRKCYSKTGRSCRVTFDLPGEVKANNVSLCGEFNDWSRESHPMACRKDGRFSTTVSLEAGQTCRLRYLLDGERWENDWAADAYVPKRFGSDDSIVKV